MIGLIELSYDYTLIIGHKGLIHFYCHILTRERKISQGSSKVKHCCLWIIRY